MLKIGNRVTISDARILLHDASTKWLIGFSRFGWLVTESDVYIEADDIILPGITISNNVVIGIG